MWKQFVDFAASVVTLTQRVQQQEAITKELRQEMKAVNEKVDELGRLVRHLAYELERDREIGQRDREIQRLSLENSLLRLERGLPLGVKRQSEDNS